jgi:vitamin B12 transporter
MNNKNRPVAAGAACLLVAPVLVMAQQPDPQKPTEELQKVVVTATRSGDGVRADVLGSSFTVLDSVDLERRQTRIVSDVLRDVPGIAVNRSGGVGGFTQIRIRGAESRHTLTLIDGIKASDPYANEFDFATLIADEVARLEVLRGQQSALYGSDAIGGVINYITPTGREAPGLRARLEGGSFGSVDSAAHYGGFTDTVDYSFSAGYQSTDGTPDSRFGSRELASNNTAVSGKLTFSPTDNFRVKAVGRYSRTRADTNDQDFFSDTSPPFGFVVDTPGSSYKNRAAYALVRAELDSVEGKWTNALEAQGVDARRDGFFAYLPSFGDEGTRQRYSYQSTLRFGTSQVPQSVTAVYDHERETFQNTGPFLSGDQGRKRDVTNKGVVVQYDGRVNERIGFGAAIRHDDNTLFDSDTTYRLQGSYRFEGGFRLRAAAGSGTKRPGFFDLFGFDPATFIGNPNLKPEKSRGWEVGVDQPFAGDQVSVSLTYFSSELQDEIFTRFLPPDFLSSPANRPGDSTQKGVEAFVSARIGTRWHIDGAYTYLDAKESSGLEEILRPPHIASVNVGWRAPADKAGVDLTVRYNGSTFDNDFTLIAAPDGRTRLPSFTLVNLGGDWRLSNAIQLYARVENLFDEDYEEVYTFKAPGRAEYAGVRITF